LRRVVHVGRHDRADRAAGRVRRRSLGRIADEDDRGVALPGQVRHGIRRRRGQRGSHGVGEALAEAAGLVVQVGRAREQRHHHSARQVEHARHGDEQRLGARRRRGRRVRRLPADRAAGGLKDRRDGGLPADVEAHHDVVDRKQRAAPVQDVGDVREIGVGGRLGPCRRGVRHERQSAQEHQAG
jgi:hypothetical protein